MAIYVEGPAPASESGLEWQEVETPPDFEELLVLCLDTSLSMKNDQYREHPGISRTEYLIQHLFAEKQGEGLYYRLMTSAARRRFWTAVLTFSDRVDLVFPPMKLFDEATDSYRWPNAKDESTQQLLFAHRMGTAIGGALVKAEEIAKGWIGEATTLPRMVTIAVISDGKPHLDTADAVAVARRINTEAAGERTRLHLSRQPIVIAAAAYGHGDSDQADWLTLKRITTDPVRFYAEPENGRQLRKFLESTMLTER